MCSADRGRKTYNAVPLGFRGPVVLRVSRSVIFKAGAYGFFLGVPLGASLPPALHYSSQPDKMGFPQGVRDENISLERLVVYVACWNS